MNFARTSKKTQSICLNSELLAKRKYKIHKLVLHQSVEYSKKHGFDVESEKYMIEERFDAWGADFVRNYMEARKIVTGYENRKKMKIFWDNSEITLGNSKKQKKNEKRKFVIQNLKQRK
jgi:hypothetical protein